MTVWLLGTLEDGGDHYEHCVFASEERAKAYAHEWLHDVIGHRVNLDYFDTVIRKMTYEEIEEYAYTNHMGYVTIKREDVG
tara:strand:- start:5852 stop:6094 length:243 start_codon:yes stop_codon:yes gene_type:complete